MKRLRGLAVGAVLLSLVAGCCTTPPPTPCPTPIATATPIVAAHIVSINAQGHIMFTLHGLLVAEYSGATPYLNAVYDQPTGGVKAVRRDGVDCWTDTFDARNFSAPFLISSAKGVCP